jgi:CheY-like chemotaxis protein
MEPDLLARVFDLFTQAERSSDRSQGGLGLGLALARSLVELHGGTLAAHSAGPGKGSTFTIRLPRGAEPLAQPPAATEAGAIAAAAPLRILLVDDNVDAVHTLQMLLRTAGHEVEIAFCAEDALALARVFQPDACLLDIGLPDFDGNELARRLRQMPQAAGALLIAMTGYGRKQDREAALACGFDHYFVKPVDIAKLSALLAEAGAGQPQH